MVKRRARKPRKSFADINMTPLLDLTFLLLIAFLITFPALEQGITLNLPKASAEALPTQKKPASISVNRDGQAFLNNQPMSDDELRNAINALAADTEVAVLIRGDEKQTYGRIMEIVKMLNAANIKKLALVTQSE